MTGVSDGLVERCSRRHNGRSWAPRHGHSADVPPALGDAFARDGDKQAQWRALLKRGRLDHAPAELSTVTERLAAFLMPPARAGALGDMVSGGWGGGWGVGREYPQRAIAVRVARQQGSSVLLQLLATARMSLINSLFSTSSCKRYCASLKSRLVLSSSFKSCSNSCSFIRSRRWVGSQAQSTS
jgi:hypothetical protein